MAIQDIEERRRRIIGAFDAKQIPYALVGGQAVAVWVSTVDPAAVRTTKDVDLLIRRDDLPKARAAALTVDMDYCEILGVGMFLERDNPNPRQGVHLIWSGERIRPDYVVAAPLIENSETAPDGSRIVSVADLATMKLMANRDQDRVHLRDLIELDLVGRGFIASLPALLAERLDGLLTEMGR